MANKVNKKIESLLEGIAVLKGWQNPDSYTYQIKNPLLITSCARPGKHEIDAEGRRIFNSWLSGFKASLFDLEMKVSGNSRCGVKADGNLSDLLKIYGIDQILGQDQVVKYLRRALKDSTVAKDMPLSYFRNHEESR